MRRYLLALGFFALGCGVEAGEEDLASTEQHDEINPQDQDKDKLGELVIEPWSFSGLPSSEAIDPSTIRVTIAKAKKLYSLADTDKGTLTYGKALRLLEGDYVVTVKTDHTVKGDFPVTVVRKTKTSFTLPLAAIRVDFPALGSVVVPEADFGILPDVPTYLPKIGVTYPWIARSPEIPLGQTVVLLSTSTLHYGWTGGTGKTAWTIQTLAANTFTEFVGPPAPSLPTPSSFAVNVEIPKRSLPDYTKQPHVFECEGSTRTASLPATSAPLHAFVQPGTCVFRIGLPNQAHGPAVQLTQDTKAAQTVAIKRIDVNDVDVTPEDGGPKYRVRGAYKVVDSGGQLIAEQVTTGRGIDVLPGKYYVEINYVVTGDAKTQKFTLDLK